MNKGKAARLLGFIGALGLSTALVATAAQGTGAYFTDSEAGSLTGTTGSLNIVASSQVLNFTGLNPGEDQEKTINYDILGTTKADVWLRFDSTSKAYGEFTGNKGTSYEGFTDGGMGGFGHFYVAGQAGYYFESYNLQLDSAASAIPTAAGTHLSNANGKCNVNQNGNGGSTDKFVGTNNGTDSPPECGVPAFIKLASNVAPGTSGTITVKFGVTGKMTAQNSMQPTSTVPFDIVATQANVRPDALNY